jgi:hypothetical protein
VITHVAALAAAHPGHVSNLKYATETWTPGGTVLAVIIIAVLIFAWLKLVPSGPKVTARRDRAPARTRAAARREAPARR